MNIPKQAIALSTAIVFLAFIIFTTQNRNRTAQIAASYAQTLTLLSNQQTQAVRIGAIDNLGLIANEFPEYHWSVVEVLSAYIQERSPLPQHDVPFIQSDIQSALSIISNRQYQRDPVFQLLEPRKTINLQKSNLRGANLERANLVGANLKQVNLSLGNLNLADLRQADFTKANLTQANLRVTNLQQARLNKVILQGSELSLANLTKTNLIGANLRKAELSRANLSYANLTKADFTGADLRKANLSQADITDAIFSSNVKNLTLEQIKSAKNWQNAHFTARFWQKLKKNPD